MENHSIFMLAGEPSGDLHAGHLAAQLKSTCSNVIIEGVAGPHMRREGISGPLSMEDFLVMGFTDVIKNLPKLYRQFQQICEHIITKQPHCVVFIDYPGFNLRMAKALRKKGYQGKLVHYISPSVWAHGKKRIDSMAKNLDLLLTIYPFEAAHFAHTPLPVEYVGNPLCNYIKSYKYNHASLESIGIKGDMNVVGVFPGSRPEEIKRNLPVILEAAQQFLQKHPRAIFAISCATSHIESAIRSMIQKKLPGSSENFVFVPKNLTYELMQNCRCAIAKSGTVTLELALHSIPTVVIYKLTVLNKFIAKYILRLSLPYFCIVNILENSEIFPELIAKDAKADDLTNVLHDLYSNDIFRKQRIQACQILQKHLGNNNASSSAANAIIKLLS